MSLRLPTLLFVVVLVFAFTIAEAGPEASHDHDHEDDHDHDHEEPHDHAEDCPDACTAVADGDSDTIKDFVEEEHEICDCECNNNGWTPLLVAAKYGCPACIDVSATLKFTCLILVFCPAPNHSTIKLFYWCYQQGRQYCLAYRSEGL